MTHRGIILGLSLIFVGCALPAAEDLERGAESAGRRIYLTPVDARARVLCRDEDNRYYCSQAEADAARARCAAKVGSACVGDACVRARVTNEPCVSSGETYPDAASCKTPRPDNCSFYSACVEKQNPCGESGYALGYGEKYCNAFANESGFSATGTAWMKSTMLCLQRHLAADDLRVVSCTALTDDAFASHPDCYTQPGASICDLGPGDALLVLRTISATDLLSSRAVKQEAAVVRTCIAHVFGRLFGAGARSFAANGQPVSEIERAELLERMDFWTKMERELAEQAP